MDEILDFWFEEIEPARWFGKSPAFDATCLRRFLALYQRAVRGELDAWEETPLGCVALVLILDQLPRNMFRDTPQAFASDAQALATTRHAVAGGFDLHPDLNDSHRHFLYMPFQHSERIEDQREALRLGERVTQYDFLGYARRHFEIIERFGRFPHRNDILQRESTAEEKTFLESPGSSF